MKDPVHKKMSTKILIENDSQQILFIYLNLTPITILILSGYSGIYLKMIINFPVLFTFTKVPTVISKVLGYELVSKRQLNFVLIAMIFIFILIYFRTITYKSDKRLEHKKYWNTYKW